MEEGGYPVRGQIVEPGSCNVVALKQPSGREQIIEFLLGLDRGITKQFMAWFRRRARYGHIRNTGGVFQSHGLRED